MKYLYKNRDVSKDKYSSVASLYLHFGNHCLWSWNLAEKPDLLEPPCCGRTPTATTYLLTTKTY